MIIAAIGSNVEDGGDKSSEPGFSGFWDCRDYESGLKDFVRIFRIFQHRLPTRKALRLHP